MSLAGLGLVQFFALKCFREHGDGDHLRKLFGKSSAYVYIYYILIIYFLFYYYYYYYCICIIIIIIIIIIIY